jgi:hypothetical protein
MVEMAETRMVAIGDMTIEDVELMSQQMEEDINFKEEELRRFREAQHLLLPVMREKGCTWGEAVKHLGIRPREPRPM